MRNDSDLHRTDVPAAFPLIALIAGLAAGPWLEDPRAAACGLLVAGVLAAGRMRVSTIAFFAALGVFLSVLVSENRAAEEQGFAALDPDRFVSIEAPLERDWRVVQSEMQFDRDPSSVLRASHFEANGVMFDVPISIYVRFEPPEVEMEAVVRVEAFLRVNDHGEYTASVKSSELLGYEGRLMWWQPAAWNRALANRLERHAGDHPDEVALAQALALGRGERLSEEMRESFRRGGTYHLLVFSGLQIAFAAGLFAAFLRWIHAPRASDWLLLAFAVLAPLFIGPTASVSRASIAIGLYALSRLFRRPTSIENLWCVAALLRLIIEPRDLTEPSFHLTYAGAGALLFIGKHLAERRWFAHALAAEVSIAPLTLFHFHQYALGGSLVTLAMSPLIFAMLILSALACASPWFLRPITMLHRLCGVLNGAGLSGYFAAPPTGFLIAGGSLALLALAMLRGRRRAVFILLALLIPTAAAIVRSLSGRHVLGAQLTFFDVGQGDASALRSGRKTMLVDGGRDRRLLPLLADRGIRRIDHLVLTHAHPDHCGALPEIVEEFDVGMVHVSPRRFRGDCAAKLLAACIVSRTPIRPVADLETFELDELRIVAHLADRTFRRAAENNASVVLHARAGRARALLTGDIEREAELTLADRDLRSDVLKVAHHGSRSSTSPPVLEWIRPRMAVISCGRKNLFGHPHHNVLEALQERRIVTWRTDRDGTIVIELDDGRLYVEAGND